jgi:hypothetical protein
MSTLEVAHLRVKCLGFIQAPESSADSTCQNRNTFVKLAYRLLGPCGELQTGIKEPNDAIFLKGGVVAASTANAVTAHAKTSCAYLGRFRACGWLVVQTLFARGFSPFRRLHHCSDRSRTPSMGLMCLDRRRHWNCNRRLPREAARRQLTFTKG